MKSPKVSREWVVVDAKTGEVETDLCVATYWAIETYLKSRGWNLLLIGGTRITSASRCGNFTFEVDFTGGRPKPQQETISLDDFMRELYGIKKVEPPAKRGGKKNA